MLPPRLRYCVAKFEERGFSNGNEVSGIQNERFPMLTLGFSLILLLIYATFTEPGATSR